MSTKTALALLALLGISASSPVNHFQYNPLSFVKVHNDVPQGYVPPQVQSNAAGDGFIANAPGSTSYWLSNIQRNGAPAFGDAGYKVFRNVKDYGAKGDGSSDDTEAINKAVADGDRCGEGCDSSTVKPALVYFPPGTYRVSKPIIQHYYSQFVGDALDVPTIKALPNFEGMAVIDADPYFYKDGEAQNWYTNQNNFFRQIRNFVIDLQDLPASQGAGIHWQVAQATSLQNVRFEMVRGGDDNRQQGIFMDNGSGGFMTDLTFNGGHQGMFVGNQQFTTRNLTFNDCGTAIFMNWNWLWTFKSININNCKVGVDMANSPDNQTVGSVIIQDSKITNTALGVNSSFSETSIPVGGGALVLENVDFTGTPIAVKSFTGQTVLEGSKPVEAWVQGRTYAGSEGARSQGAITPSTRPKALIDQSGNILERSKPQYENFPPSSFVSVKSKGAKGDGKSDDTKAIQDAMNSLQADQILYFDHGAYLITSTVKVPKDIKVTGEIWPLIMASGEFFSDENNPKPMFEVGEPNDSGAAEFSDLMFETAGPAPGAILMRWNSAASAPASNAMYDVHFRVGGSAGTQLQSDKCAKNPNVTHGPNPECVGANLLFHATDNASVYVENCWFWVSDHELDRDDHSQIDIYNARGVLLETQGPVWMYGTASEHNVLYNYQLRNAKNIYMGTIQTETPYYQGNPAAPAPFKLQTTDPQFDGTPNGDNKAWGLRIVDSSDILVYGAGLYSFFENYGQTCVPEQNCQNHMVSVEGATDNLSLFGLSTKAAINMVSTTGAGYNSRGRAVSTVNVLDQDNRSNFCATLAMWRPE